MARRDTRPPEHRPFLVLALALIVAACASGGTGSATSESTSPPTSLAPESTESATASAIPAPSSDAPPPEPSPLAAATWRPLPSGDAGPQAREDGTWTTDPAGRTSYLFGGRDGTTIFDDLWAFDLATNTWTALDPGGDAPSARFGHEAVWVDGIGVVVFAGQAGPTTFFNDLWAYNPDGNRWTELVASGSRPKARYGTCAAIGPDGRLWISHGFTEDGTRFADTQAFDFSTSRWADVTPGGQVPVSRCLHGCWWTDDSRFVLYAGQTTGVEALGDLWTLEGAGGAAATWARATGPLPSDRNLYAFTQHGDAVVVVGGRGLGRTFLDDAFTIDGSSLAITPLEPDGTKPPGRGGAMLVDDPAGGRVVLFGGKDADGSLDDLWELALP